MCSPTEAHSPVESQGGRVIWLLWGPKIYMCAKFDFSAPDRVGGSL